MNEDLVFEGNTAIWDMGAIVGEVQGTYTGSFKFRCFLTPTQRLEAGRLYRELLGPQMLLATEEEGSIAFAISQLKQRVIKAPPFWNAMVQDGEMEGNIADHNVLLAILDAAIRSESAYREKMKDEAGKTLNSTIAIAERILNPDKEEKK